MFNKIARINRCLYSIKIIVSESNESIFKRRFLLGFIKLFRLLNIFKKYLNNFLIVIIFHKIQIWKLKFFYKLRNVFQYKKIILQLCSYVTLIIWKHGKQQTIKEIVYSALCFNISERLQLNFNCDWQGESIGSAYF